MAVGDYLKVSRKTFVNPRAWFGVDTIKDQNRTIWTILKSAFTPDKPLREETFEAAMKRLNLTEADVHTISTRYRFYALIFLLLGLAAFAYAFFLLFRYWTITGWMLSMAVTGLLMAQAFKYDFWAFQIRRRKLGLTFNEWKQFILGDKGPSA